MHAILIFWCYFATLSKDLPAVFIFWHFCPALCLRDMNTYIVTETVLLNKWIT
jgi:hypothetical protein